MIVHFAEMDYVLSMGAGQMPLPQSLPQERHRCPPAGQRATAVALVRRLAQMEKM